MDQLFEIIRSLRDVDLFASREANKEIIKDFYQQIMSDHRRAHGETANYLSENIHIKCRVNDDPYINILLGNKYLVISDKEVMCYCTFMPFNTIVNSSQIDLTSESITRPSVSELVEISINPIDWILDRKPTKSAATALRK